MYKRKNRLTILWLVILVCLGLNGLAFPPCEASDKDAATRLVSLDAQGESLSMILEALSQSVGHDITASQEWADVVLSIRLERVELEEALKRIIVALGSPSHVILHDSWNRKTEILILAGAPERTEVRTGARTQRSTKVTASSVIEATAEPLDPRRLEVIPPEAPGENGITQEELEALLTGNDASDPRDVEVIPPEETETRGVTQAELEEMLRGREGGESGHGH